MPKLGYKQTNKHRKHIKQAKLLLHKDKNYSLRIVKNFGKYDNNKKNKHHLDLNESNNSKNNLLYLKNGKHQQFHRLAYHYLLEKYGIKEIRKYLKWFKKNYGVK